MGISWSEIFTGLLTVIILMVGEWCRNQAGSIKELQDFKTKTMEHWESDAKTYISKSEFMEFARELKDALIRIENKIETLRG